MNRWATAADDFDGILSGLASRRMNVLNGPRKCGLNPRSWHQ